MKTFGTNKTWLEDIEDMESYYDEVNEIPVIQISKDALVSFIKEIIEREAEITNGFTGA